jgi:hypothetical protein
MIDVDVHQEAALPASQVGALLTIGRLAEIDTVSAANGLRARPRHAFGKVPCVVRELVGADPVLEGRRGRRGEQRGNPERNDEFDERKPARASGTRAP